MKKIIAAVLCLTMCFALLSACGTENKPAETDPVTSEEPSTAPTESAEPSEEPSEQPSDEPGTAPETEAPATSALADAITSARTDEENEAYPVFSDKAAIEDAYYQVVGFTAADVDDIAMSVSLINVKALSLIHI